NDLDQLITSVPGTENIIRKRDLYSSFRSYDLAISEICLIVKEAHTIPQAQGLILNTFEELDGVILPHMRKLCPNIYTIGPLHTLHKTRLMASRTPPPQETTYSNSVWKEDKSCVLWLDKHGPKTVIYVSIGSLATMTVEQLLEIWHGVWKTFLWVRRPGSITGGYDESRVPVELLERTKEIEFIVEWAPQEDVLAHLSIGGFLTHCGWNSTIESIVEGVPMACWPYHVDQQMNSRFVAEVWKTGVDMKDTCDRLLAVRDIMDSKDNAVTQSANIWASLAKESITKTGSSSIHLGRLIDDILAMSTTWPKIIRSPSHPSAKLNHLKPSITQEWAPQEDVLAHLSIGGFLTHCGWNSTIESIVEGVPMVCWPYHADQQMNSRFVAEVWKTGVDMKDTCDRLLAVRDIMDSKDNAVTQSANIWASLAKESITKTGSSSIHLGRLIDDILAMSTTWPKRWKGSVQ
ncbi:LOW QUALITY PROTEIN: hypothetical protein M8C21_000654, partial [Ambrosia artemisiifolia]